jgi:probable HAF family extracellular repeat protein
MKTALAFLTVAAAALVTTTDGALAQPTSYSIVPITGNNYSPIDSGTTAGRSINSARQVALYFGNTLYLWSPASGLVQVGTAPGPYISPMWLNDGGEVAGFFRVTGTYLNRAFVAFPQSGITDIGTLGGAESEARGINNSGSVAGWAHPTASNARRPFVWTSAGMVDPDGSSYYGEAAGINDAGTAVGFARILYGYNRAKIWPAAGGVVDLGAPGGSQSVGRAINQSGEVAGDIIYTIGGPWKAFRYSGGLMEDLGTLGGPMSRAERINDNGTVVGYSANAAGVTRPFAWTPSMGMVDVGLPGSPAYHTGLNNLDHAVGYVQGASGDYQPYIWSAARGAVDLNTLVPCRPAGWRARTAHGISDDGAILVLSTAGPALLTPGSACGNAPVLGPVAANDPVAVNVAMQVSASFTDGDTADTHTGRWDWGDGGSSDALVTQSAGEGTLTGSHSFSSAGIYEVKLTVTDSGGKSTQAVKDVVVYDPSAGFVTGGGWFISPTGAYKADADLAGFANFGFVSRYVKGASVPTGKTEFNFQTANLNFHSDSYEWLVVSGARAQYKGWGTINGTGNFRFLLTAVDGDRLGGAAQDRFRMKIWYYDSAQQSDVTVYDNQMQTTLAGGNDEGSEVSGGSIVIHTK